MGAYLSLLSTAKRWTKRSLSTFRLKVLMLRTQQAHVTRWSSTKSQSDRPGNTELPECFGEHLLKGWAIKWATKETLVVWFLQDMYSSTSLLKLGFFGHRIAIRPPLLPRISWDQIELKWWFGLVVTQNPTSMNQIWGLQVVKPINCWIKTAIQVPPVI